MVLGIFTAGLVPVELAHRVPVSEAIQHAGAFGLLTLVACGRTTVSGGNVVWPLAAVLLSSVALEAIQPFVGRSFSLSDIAANAVGTGGAVVTLVTARAVRECRQRKSQKSGLKPGSLHCKDSTVRRVRVAEVAALR